MNVFKNTLLSLIAGSLVLSVGVSNVQAQANFPCEAPNAFIGEQTSTGSSPTVAFHICVDTTGQYSIDIVNSAGAVVATTNPTTINANSANATLITQTLSSNLGGQTVTFRLKSSGGQVVATETLNISSAVTCTPPGMVVNVRQETDFSASGCASFGPYSVKILRSTNQAGGGFDEYQTLSVAPSGASETFSLSGTLPQVTEPTSWQFQFVHSDGTLVSQTTINVTGDSSNGSGSNGFGTGDRTNVSDELRGLNPLNIGNTGTIPNQANQLSTPAGILSRFLSFVAFPLAGLILFIMIVWGGFEILAQSATKKSIDAGRQRITAAIFGFILLFTAYWAVQIIQVVFGIRILY